MKKILAVLLSLLMTASTVSAAFEAVLPEESAEPIQTSAAAPLAESPYAEVNFDFESADTQVFTTAATGYGITYSDGLMTVNTAKSSYAGKPCVTQSGQSLDTSVYRYLVLNLKNATKTATFSLNFTTTNTPVYDNANKFNFSVDTSMTSFAEYVIDMSQFAAWSGNYTGCKLYLDDVAHKGKVEIDEIRFTSDYYRDDDYHFPLVAKEYSTPFPLVGTDGCTSKLTGNILTFKCTNASSGYFEFPAPTVSCGSADYSYFIIKARHTASSYSGQLVYYFTTDQSTSRNEDKTVYSSFKTGTSGLYDYFIFSLAGNSLYKGTLKNGMIKMRSTGTLEIVDMLLSKTTDCVTDETGVEKAVFEISSASITEEGQTVVLKPTFKLPGHARVTEFADAKWAVDGTNAKGVVNEDGTLSLTGRINGDVKVTFSFTFEGETYTTDTIVPVSGQTPKLAAVDVHVLMYGNSILYHDPNDSLGWYHQCGMAASEPEKDYAHVLQTLLEGKYGKGNVRFTYGSGQGNFETSTTTATLETDYETMLLGVTNCVRENQPDIVTVQYGENSQCGNAGVYEYALGCFIDAVKAGKPDAVVMITVPFWSYAGMGTYHGAIAAAEHFGVPVANLAVISADSTNMALGEYENGGVATHPSDKGMNVIAHSMYDALLPYLTKTVDQKIRYTMLPEYVEFAQDVHTITAEEGTLALNASVYPADAAQELVYSSGDLGIATVDANGVVTAKNNGTVTITARSKYREEAAGTFEITVSGQTEPFVLTFDQNTDDTVTGMPEADHLAKNVTYFPKIYPVRETYSFLGWSLTPDGDVCGDVFVTKDTTVYAVWEKAHHFTFEREGDKEGFSVDYGFNQYVREGRFMSIATGTDVEKGEVLTIHSPKLDIPAEECRRLAIVMQNTTINNVSKLMLTVHTTDGDVYLEQPVTSKTLTTYSFDLSEATGTVTGFTLVPTNIDTTIYLEEIRLSSDCLVRYDANCDDAADMPDDEYVSVNGRVTLSSAIPVRRGYLFRGWTLKKDSKLLYSSVDAKTPVTVYAMWDKNDHWEFKSYYKEHDPQNMKSFAYKDGCLYFSKAGGKNAVIQNMGGITMHDIGYPIGSTSKMLECRMKWTAPSTDGLQMLVTYITDEHGMWEQSNVRINLAEYGNAPEDFVTFNIDLSDTAFIRDYAFDNINFQLFSNDDADFVVDYIRFTDSASDIVVSADMQLTTDNATYLVNGGATVSPVGCTVVKGLHLVGDIDFADGYIIARDSYEIDEAKSDAYQMYTLDMAALDLAKTDIMYIDGEEAPMYDGAAYFLPKSAKVTFEKTPNTTPYTLTVSGEDVIMIDGKTRTYTAKYSGGIPSDGVTFEVNHPEIAEIDAKTGVLTVKKDGSIRVTAYSDYDPTIHASMDVDIRYYSVNVTLKGEDFFRLDGKNRTYTATVTGTAKDKSVIYSVDDESVAVIDKNTGVLTAKTVGSVTVTASSAYKPDAFDSITVTIEYFDFTMSIIGPDAIAKAERAAEYTARFESEGYFDRSVIWSTDDATVATVDENGKLSPTGNGFVTLTAVSVYNPAVSASKVVEFTNQPAKAALHYHTGTQDTVTGMPEDETGYGEVKLSDTVPLRENYVFLGWSSEEDAIKYVDTVTLHDDVDVYAVWGKGVFMEFNGDIKGIAAVSGGSVTPSDKYMICRTAGDFRVTTDMLDIDPDYIKNVVIRLAVDKESYTQIFYQTQFTDKNGNPVIRGYDSDGWRYAEEFAVSQGHKEVGLDNFFILDFSMYYNWVASSGSWYAGEADLIKRLWIDISNANNSIMYVDYIRMLDERRSVTFDMNTDDEVQNVPEDYVLRQGDTLTLREKPVRDGYTFLGYSKSADGSAGTSMTFAVLDDITLYAIWQESISTDTDYDGEQTTVTLGDLSAYDGEGLVVLTDLAKNARITLTCDEGEMTEKVNADRMAAFDLATLGEELHHVTLSFDGRHSVLGSYQTATYEEAVEQRDKNTKNQSSDKPRTTPLEKDIYTVMTIPSEKPLYNPATMYLETLDDGGVVKTDSVPLERFLNAGVSQSDLSYVAESLKKGDATYRQYLNTGDVIFDFVEPLESTVISSARQMRLVSRKDSVASFEALGKWEGNELAPSLLASTLLVDADSHRYIVLLARGTDMKDASLAVSFTDDSVFYTADGLVQPLGEDYSLLVYDMAQCDEWKGLITKVRFTLVGAETGLLDIDRLIFTSKNPADVLAFAETGALFALIKQGMPFTDVQSGAWYYTDVARAYGMGFVSGMTETTYEPEGVLTLAQAMTLAVRLKRAFDGNSDTISTDCTPWYNLYLSAAVRGRILTLNQYPDMEGAATRADVAQMLYNALPKNALTPINAFGAIPDMSESDFGYAAMLSLYNAGVMIGRDGANNSYAGDSITRAEMAALLNRVAFPTQRKRVISGYEISLNRKEKTAGEIASSVRLTGCDASIPVVKTIAENVSAATGKTVNTDASLDLTKLLGTLDGNMYTTMRVGMTWDETLGTDAVPHGCTVYFATDTSTYSTQNSVNGTPNGEKDENGVHEIVFDLSSNERFATEITALRFDVTDIPQMRFGITYIILE